MCVCVCVCDNVPLVINSLDNKAQRRTDGIDVLAHDLLDDRRLSGIIQAAARRRVSNVSPIYK